MELDYKQIGARIAYRRKELRYRQSEVEEMAGIGYKYLSNIERGVSIPSLEVIVRLASVLQTTPNEFLLGTTQNQNAQWHETAELLCDMNEKKLQLSRSFLLWVREQDI